MSEEQSSNPVLIDQVKRLALDNNDDGSSKSGEETSRPALEASDQEVLGQEAASSTPPANNRASHGSVAGSRIDREKSSSPPGTMATLTQHPKHVFVFSAAGKPIYSYHGDEEQLAELMATAEAIISVVQSHNQSLSYVRSGQHVIAFMDRSPLCLVGSSSLAEPPAVLRMQLALVHGQITSLLTATALTSVFQRNPSYDARNLLKGSEIMIQNLIESFTQSPAALLGAYPSFALLPGVRKAVHASLIGAIKASNALFGLVLSQGAVVCLASSPTLRPPNLQQWDILLLLNFLKSNEALKLTEAFTPLCLPHYNPSGHLHTYIHYIDAATDTCIVLFVGGSSPDFHSISQSRQDMQEELESIGAVQEILGAARHGALHSSGLRPSVLPGNIGGGALGASPLLHCTYKLSVCQQFVCSPFEGLSSLGTMQRDIVVAYSQMRANMFDHAGERMVGPLQSLRYEARSSFVLFGSATAESELYLVLDALTNKEEAVAICSRLHAWLKQQHTEMFQLDL